MGDAVDAIEPPEPIVTPPGVALLTIHSPNGTAWTITVDDNGGLLAVPIVGSTSLDTGSGLA